MRHPHPVPAGQREDKDRAHLVRPRGQQTRTGNAPVRCERSADGAHDEELSDHGRHLVPSARKSDVGHAGSGTGCRIYIYSFLFYSHAFILSPL